MPTAHIPRCQYIRTGGTRCGSPSLRTERYCYFHYEVNRTVAFLDIPPLEDGNAIQLALTDLARAIVEERIALKPAALLAYILQTASANLKRVQLGVFKDEMITELPALDPYSRGLFPEPGERNRDPELSCHPERGASSVSRVEGPGRPPRKPALSEVERAREGRIRSALSPVEAQGFSPGNGDDERIPTTLPEAGAQPAGAAPKRGHELTRKIAAAKAGSLKDAKALLGLLKGVG